MNNIISSIKVVVIGSIHHNTLGVIRSLGEIGIDIKNIHVLLVSNSISEKNMITVSSYVTKENVGYIGNCDKIINWLTNLAKDGEKRVIICCSDATAETVINNSSYLSAWFKTPSTALNVLELMEKDVQCTIAEKCGLRIPYSAVYNKGECLNWNIFPCITKPIKSAFGAGKQDIFIDKNPEELESSLKQIEADTIQIQEYIEKEVEFQLIGCSLDAGKHIIIPGYTTIIRQPPNTNTGYLKYSSIDELNFDVNSVYEFIKQIGYSGLFSVEFLRGMDGNDYYLEINMRNDGNAYCVQSAGVNLPFIWSYYQMYGELPEVKLGISKSIYFIPDFNDLKVAIRSVGIFRWIKDFITADSHSIYNKKDMKPFIYEFKRQIRRVFHL